MQEKEEGVRMGKRYSEEFKKEAVGLYHSTERGYNPVAGELGVSAYALRQWVAKYTDDDDVSLTEREELRKLRSENRRLRLEREILRKAAAFFATETNGIR